MIFSKSFPVVVLYLTAKFSRVAADLASRNENEGGVVKSDNFHMTLDFPETKLHRRSINYINDTGYITTDQSQATVYYIENGQLTSNGGDIVSADPSDNYIVFEPGSSAKSISTTWTQNGNLAWYYPSFAGNGIAKYCQDANSRVYLVLHSQPSQCKPAVASPVPTAPANGIAYYGYSTSSLSAVTFNGKIDVDIVGIAQDINFALDSSLSITFPGQKSPTYANVYSVVYQGYFLAPVTSSYTLTSLITTDDSTWIWYGEHAFSAWADSNYDAEESLRLRAGAVTFSLHAGEKIPITILWENYGGPGNLDFTVYTAATGKTSDSTAGFFSLPVKGDGFSNSGLVPKPS